MRVAALAIVVLVATGCVRVDQTEVRVRDVHALGVVGDEKNEWLLPPGGPPQTVEIYRSALLGAQLAREPSGAITYTSRHWALGERIDTTVLANETESHAWTASTWATNALVASIERGGALRLRPIRWVRDTGPFGTCNGTLFDACVTNPAVSLSIATDARNIEEVRVHRTALHGLGIGETILGGAVVGFATAVGVIGLESDPSDGRNVVLGLGAGFAVLGGLLLANGLWRVLTPDEDFVYRPTTGP